MTTTVTVTTVEDDKYCERKVTVGKLAQNHVLRDFNPALTDNNIVGQKVDTTKALCAAVIQQMLDLRDAPSSTVAQKRGASIAITLMEGAQSAAVKANFASGMT